TVLSVGRARSQQQQRDSHRDHQRSSSQNETHWSAPLSRASSVEPRPDSVGRRSSAAYTSAAVGCRSPGPVPHANHSTPLRGAINGARRVGKTSHEKVGRSQFRRPVRGGGKAKHPPRVWPRGGRLLVAQGHRSCNGQSGILTSSGRGESLMSSWPHWVKNRS